VSAAAPVVRTFRGQFVDGMLSGTIMEADVTFEAAAEPPTGPTLSIAGFYEAPKSNSASGMLYSVVGTQGRVFVLVITSDSVSAVMGQMDAANAFTTLMVDGGTIELSIDELTTVLTGKVGRADELPVVFAGANKSSLRTDRLINLSSRARVGPAANQDFITGFVIGGTQPRRVLLRAIGPALEAFGISAPIPDPQLRLYDSAGGVVITNDDWSGAEIVAGAVQVGAFGLSAGSRDAALLATLAPGAYTLQVLTGHDTGIALAEIYDASANVENGYAERLINFSSRGRVDAGEHILIGGFVVTGNRPKRVLIRGAGPALTALGVADTLSDPRLTLYSGGGVIALNDDWGVPEAASAAQTVAGPEEIAARAHTAGAFAFSPGSNDAALVVTLLPGTYTAQISGVNGTSGVALVEIYEIQD
jgi:hypothetical protein